MIMQKGPYMSSIHYGVVGAGYFGQALGRTLARLPGASVVAVYDPRNAEKLTGIVGGRATASVEELCAAPDVDAIVVASPNWAHIEPVLAAAKNGIRRCDLRVRRGRRILRILPMSAELHSPRLRFR